MTTKHTRKFCFTVCVGLSLLWLTACVSSPESNTQAVSGNPQPTTQSEVTIDRGNLIAYNGQQLFLNGMNLAWMDYGKDLDNFNEFTFAGKLNDIAYNGGNAIRWWLFVNGARSPSFDPSGKAQPLPQEQIDNLKRALDMAADRGVGLMLCLWSFDMMQTQAGVDNERNRKLLEDPEYTNAFLNNTLIPLVQELKGHPGIIAWEVFNEPEGMIESFGWTPKRVSFPTVQAFVNKVAGAIHRADPQARVTNGSWNMQVLTDINGLSNKYRDDRLIAAGGDPLGVLDFYTVHFYPEHFDESTSPFHHPKSHWKLDKPLVIAEFPAKGIVQIPGKASLQVKTRLTTQEAYAWALEQGYAGALSWTMSNHDGFGGVNSAADAMNYINDVYPEYVKVDTSNRIKTPIVQKPLPAPLLLLSQKLWPNILNLQDYIVDSNENGKLTYTVSRISHPSMVNVTISDNGQVSAELTPNASAANITVTISSRYQNGPETKTRFLIHVLDPDRGNIALFKPSSSKSIDIPENKPEFATDGNLKTRWSSQYADDEWLDIDLQGTFLVSSASIQWEVAYGKQYELLGSLDGKNWFLLHSVDNSDGGLDEFSFTPQRVAHVRLLGKVRATEWGYSTWEVQVNGERVR